MKSALPMLMQPRTQVCFFRFYQKPSLNVKRISGGEITQKAITVFFPPRSRFQPSRHKKYKVSVIAEEFKAKRQSTWALEMFVVSGR